MECKQLMPWAQVTSSWLIAKKQHSSQSYMQKRNKTELHIAHHSIKKIIAAWQNWKRVTFTLVRLAFKRRCWSFLGVHLRTIKNRYLNSIRLDMASGSSPTAGRRRKYKSCATRAAEEAADRLEQPVLPELSYLRGHDGPSDNEEENDAKRPRSTSTTPKSARGMDPDEYDRMMGVSSAHPSEGDRFGDGNVTDTEEMGHGVANGSTALTPIVSGLGSCPGADLDLKGCGSARLLECLDRNLSRVSSLAAPAACASDGAAEYLDLSPTCDRDFLKAFCAPNTNDRNLSFNSAKCSWLRTNF